MHQAYPIYSSSSLDDLILLFNASIQLFCRLETYWPRKHRVGTNWAHLSTDGPKLRFPYLYYYCCSHFDETHLHPKRITLPRFVAKFAILGVTETKGCPGLETHYGRTVRCIWTSIFSSKRGGFEKAALRFPVHRPRTFQLIEQRRKDLMAAEEEFSM